MIAPSRQVSWAFPRGAFVGAIAHAYIDGVCVCPGTESRAAGAAAPPTATRCARCLESFPELGGEGPRRIAPPPTPVRVASPAPPPARPAAPARDPLPFRPAAEVLRQDARAAALVAALDDAGHGVLLRELCERHGIRHPEVLLGRDRHARLAFARHHLAWELRELGYSYPEIGRAMGRDHTTVMASCRTFERAAGIVSAPAAKAPGERGAA